MYMYINRTFLFFFCRKVILGKTSYEPFHLTAPKHWSQNDFMTIVPKNLSSFGLINEFMTFHYYNSTKYLVCDILSAPSLSGEDLDFLILPDVNRFTRLIFSFSLFSFCRIKKPLYISNFINFML